MPKYRTKNRTSAKALDLCGIGGARTTQIKGFLDFALYSEKNAKEIPRT